MKKILIVDDQIEVRELVKVTLEVGPYQILEAENGYQALELAQASQPDLILLDVMMPDGPDGIAVCQTLKANDATNGVTIVMLTARGQEADVETGYRAGADGYFVKPFSPLELIQKVEALLED